MYHTNGMLYDTVGVLITLINVWLELRSVNTAFYNVAML